MRVVLASLFLFLFNYCFTQDTLKSGFDFTGKIVQKEFNSSQNYIKIVYQYDDCGVLIRRLWYNKDGIVISVCLAINEWQNKQPK